MSINCTGIEWTDYTWNPITGCLHGCPYCYAKKITKRFPKNYPNGFNPTFYPERLDDPGKVKKPSMIFTVSMGDMFGSWVDIAWIEKIIETIRVTNRHQFQILTKNPVRATSIFDIIVCPDNLWIGTTVENADVTHRISELPPKDCGGLRFASFEPLLSSIPDIDLSPLDWIIIGAQTNPLRLPDNKWVEGLITAARDTGIPVFLKNSIQKYYLLCQEFPEVIV